jgi:broad-specificity NMP kinase
MHPEHPQYACVVRRILVTGMSGTGKSTALAELARRGFSVVETDVAPWSEWSEKAGGYVWNEKLVGELLDHEQETTLFVSGTVSNQGRFYPRFDAVVLLSAPTDVLLRRINGRTTNDYGKSVDERERILSDVSVVEPLLRATCTHEIDARRSVGAVVGDLLAIERRLEHQPAVERT